MSRQTSSAKVGPDSAATLANGIVSPSMPPIVRPVSNSIPLVTLTATPSNLAKRAVTSRNARDGIASTTQPAPSTALARSDSVGRSAGRSTPGK